MEQTPEGVSVTASHDGYAWLRATHRRTLTLGEHSLSIDDDVDAPHVSRLRFAADAPPTGLRSLLAHDTQAHSWYPKHGVRAPARVATQAGVRRTGWVVTF